MRIAIVHSFYRSDFPSGENQVVVAQHRALEEAGHTVALIAAYTDSLAKSTLYPLRAANWVATGRGLDPTGPLREFNPDVVHVHNLFPNFGTRWLVNRPWPLVSSIHNYRAVCANGLLYRNGAPCRECPDEGSWHSVVHGCYRGSRMATIPLAISSRGGAPKNAVLRATDVMIVPSDRAFNAFLGFGIERERLKIVPYFVTDRYRISLDPPFTPRWLIASRLSPEKGVHELLKAWPSNQHLDIAGAGPLEESLAADAPGGVRLLGFKEPGWLDEHMPRYTGLVFPGRSPEGIPSVVIQALAAGIPIVAREGNGASDLVRAHEIGSVYGEGRADDSLSAGLAKVINAGERYRLGARSLYETDFTPEVWVRRVEQAYALAVEKDASRRYVKK